MERGLKENSWWKISQNVDRTNEKTISKLIEKKWFCITIALLKKFYKQDWWMKRRKSWEDSTYGSRKTGKIIIDFLVKMDNSEAGGEAVHGVHWSLNDQIKNTTAKLSFVENRTIDIVKKENNTRIWIFPLKILMSIEPK